MKIPVYHMEAGNRSFDKNVPEELNRKLVDHIADFNLVYTEHARRHLLSEGLSHRRIVLTGSPMREVLDFHSESISASTVLKTLKLSESKYFVVSLHREENVDSEARLRCLISALNTLAKKYDYPIIMSTHPRTRKRMQAYNIELHYHVQDMKPFGFFDYNMLQKNSYCAISDSGTIAEESSILNFPAVTPRDSIERPEGIDVGSIINTGVEPDSIVSGVSVARKFYDSKVENGLSKVVPADYQIKNTAERVVSLIVGTANLSNSWDGIRK
jgi:UDP-N-acetylglucosamine 2-epimerase (non-hydrolysing)